MGVLNKEKVVAFVLLMMVVNAKSAQSAISQIIIYMTQEQTYF